MEHRCQIAVFLPLASVAQPIYGSLGCQKTGLSGNVRVSAVVMHLENIQKNVLQAPMTEIQLFGTDFWHVFEKRV